MYRALFFGGDRPEPLSRYLAVAPPPRLAYVCADRYGRLVAQSIHTAFFLLYILLLPSPLFFRRPEQAAVGRGKRRAGVRIGYRR